MDNEEIRKLLQELKESSDESSAVRSKVVKIHVDTPDEAKRRQRVKEREKEKELKRQAEEMARAQAEEDARHLEAERAAKEAVEEAKRQAKAGFAADLDEAILTGNSGIPDPDEAGENADDLDLNWGYEKPELTSGFVKAEDLELEGEKLLRKQRAASGEDSDADDTGFDSDEADFRSDYDEERESITGLPGHFGKLFDRGVAFFGGIRKSVKEDLSKARGRGQEEDAEEDFGSDFADDGEPEASYGSDFADDEPGGFSGSDLGEKEAKGLSGSGFGSREDRRPVSGSDRTGEAADVLAVSAPAASAESGTPVREYGPDEEWKRRMEEPPRKKPRFRLSLPKKESFGQFLPKKKDKKEPFEESTAGDIEASGFEPMEPADENGAYSDDMQPAQSDAGNLPDEGFVPSGEITASDAEMPAPAGEMPASDAEMSALAGETTEPTAEMSAPAGEITEPTAEMSASAGEMSEPGGEAPASAGETLVQEESRNIEIIDLNENQNNKGAEVIPLVGDTGPLPDPAELKKEGAKRGLFKSLSREKRPKKEKPKKERPKKEKPKKEKPKKETLLEENPEKETLKEEKTKRVKRKEEKPKREKPKKERPVRVKKGGAVKDFVLSHKKQCIIAVVAAVVLVLLAVLIVFVAGRMKDARHASVEAEEGLTVRVLKQPDSFVTEGDVQISLKAPETIQSVTVNGENVVAEQGRSTDFMYHANGGTLDIMAVSTDKVRSAKVILAYVDSQPPSVTIREEDGRIALSAEDTESGVDAIYIGDAANEFTDIPQYEKYSGTLEMNPDKEITYYAVDQAGNATTPVTVALTPAESIEFERENYSLFPGSVEKVNLITKPANAFVNNLTLEAENPKVIQVEGDMMIRGMAEGDTKLTATADGIPGVMANASVSSERKVTISAIGDCTLGTDASFSQNNSFDAYQAMYGNSYFFEKVKGILSADDSTFANFEGTLTTSEDRRDKKFTFKGDPSFGQILVDGSVEVVSLANNHAHDFKEQGLEDTKRNLEAAGIEWCEGAHIAWKELNGVRCAFIGIYALENGLDSLPEVESTIAEAKKKGADLIIVGFHWGVELVTELDEFERTLAHAAIDAGANLVVGTHSHVLMAIEKYNGAYICYGLGNFCFGGSTNPTSYDTIIWQQTFNFTPDGLESEDDISIIPCQVSGDTSINNYQPVPVSGDTAARIMGTIDSLSQEFGQTYSQYMVDGTMWTGE